MVRVNDMLRFRIERNEYVYDNSLIIEGFHIYIGNQTMLSKNPSASTNHTPHSVYSLTKRVLPKMPQTFHATNL